MASGEKLESTENTVRLIRSVKYPRLKRWVFVSSDFLYVLLIFIHIHSLPFLVASPLAFMLKFLLPTLFQTVL